MTSTPVPSSTMDRIAVIGCGGSGKTYLANRLAALLDLTVTHLDVLYYGEDWAPLPAAEFAELQHKLVAEPRWLIEGNYASTLPIRLQAADTVIFLDLPAWACLWGIAQRRRRYRGGQHADGVYDRITWDFVKYVLRYRKTMRPRVEDLIGEHGAHARYIVLRSRRETARFLAQLPAVR
jgi:adenylate kinase family enzyme